MPLTSARNSYKSTPGTKKYKKRKSRSRRSNTKKMVQQYKRMSYNSMLQSKLNRMANIDIFWGQKHINEIHEPLGKIELYTDSATNDSLPLYAFKLNSVLQGGTDAGFNSALKLKFNGYDFAGQGQTTEYLGSVPTTSGQGSLIYNQLLQRYIEISLCLRSSPLKRLKYTVMLVKFKDAELAPTHVAVTDLTQQENRRIFYEQVLLRAGLTNPIEANTRSYYNQAVRQKYKILWKKDYHIDEAGVNGRDEHHWKTVKIFRKTDKIINFMTKQDVTTDTVPDDPDAVNLLKVQSSSIATPDPEVYNQLFLIIMANTSKSVQEDASLFDKASFDISIKTKYTKGAAMGNQ